MGYVTLYRNNPPFPFKMLTAQSTDPANRKSLENYIKVNTFLYSGVVHLQIKNFKADLQASS